ncbi:MAG TPA: cupin domain-containing protein [Desulfarculaceae bacterium]|nr:cupin domain-containing protein [Desulfarculaceae bacterium]
MFKHLHYTEVAAEKVTVEGANKVTVRWVIDETDGAPTFAMRIFEFEANGHTPYHSHDWEHEIFILAEDGYLTIEDEKKPIKPGDVVFIPGGTMHNLTAGSKGLRMMCLVPVGCK